jgi:chemotaxis protein CheX
MTRIPSDRITVLLIDDEKEIIEDLKFLLTTKNMRVYTASSGTEGYSKACNLRVDVIVTDFRMPIMNGGQLLTLLKSSRLISQIPILFFSGCIDEAKRTVGEGPMTRFLAKPSTAEAIATEIQQLHNEKQIRVNNSREVDGKVLGSFIEATKETFKMMLSLKVCEASRPFSAGDLHSIKSHVSSLLHISGDRFKGAFLMSFPPETLLSLSKQLFEHSHQQVNAEVADMAGEMMNIVWGQTKVKLAANKYLFHTSVPTVFVGNSSSNISMSDGPTLIVPFQTDFGSFNLIFFMAAEPKRANAA